MHGMAWHMLLQDELCASWKVLSFYYSSLSLQSSKVFDKRLLQVRHCISHTPFDSCALPSATRI